MKKRIIHLAALAAVALTAACTTIHTGETVRFKTYADQPPLRRFADLTALDAEAEGSIVLIPGAFNPINWDWYRRLLPGARTPLFLRTEFELFVAERYGVPPEMLGSIFNASVVASDARRGAELDELDSELRSIQTDRNLAADPERKAVIIDEIIESARSQGRLSPLLETKLLEIDGNVAAAPRYFYPQVDVVLSATLNLMSDDVTLSDLGVVLTLDPQLADRVQIVDFSPKQDDVQERRKGSHSESTRAGGSISDDEGDNDQTVIRTDDGNLSTTFREDTNERRSLDYSFNENYSADVMDIVEAHTTGLIENGAGFYARHQARGNQRISGTRTYRLLLRVAARPADIRPDAAFNGEFESADGDNNFGAPEPLAWEPDLDGPIRADVHVIGVVRHRNRRGYVGYLHRVPEPSNDDVYEQVVARKIAMPELWSPEQSRATSRVEVVVVSNSRDARYVVGTNGDEDFRALATGSGESRRFFFSRDEIPDTAQLAARFLPIVSFNDRRGFESLTVENVEIMEKSPHREYIILGTYREKPL